MSKYPWYFLCAEDVRSLIGSLVTRYLAAPDEYAVGLKM